MRGSILAIAVSVSAGLMACATPRSPPTGPRYALRQPIGFADLWFEVTGSSFSSHLANGRNEVTRCPRMCLTVYMNLSNQSGGSLAPAFQPTYQLIDRAGVAHGPNLARTSDLNSNLPGRPVAGESLAGGISYNQAVVFEVPEGRYLVQIQVPRRPYRGSAGGAPIGDGYFLVDLQEPD